MEVPDQSDNDPKNGLVEVIEVIEIVEREEHTKRHGTH